MKSCRQVYRERYFARLHILWNTILELWQEEMTDGITKGLTCDVAMHAFGEAINMGYALGLIAEEERDRGADWVWHAWNYFL